MSPVRSVVPFYHLLATAFFKIYESTPNWFDVSRDHKHLLILGLNAFYILYTKWKLVKLIISQFHRQVLS